MNSETIYNRYQNLLGYVPKNIQQRIELAKLAEHSEAISAIEHLRQTLIHDNPLDSKTQQLVHFAMLISAGEIKPARFHCDAALKAGANVAELFGVCETAAIVGGMPAFTSAISILSEALTKTDESNKQ